MNKIFNYEEHETRAALWALQEESNPIVNKDDDEASWLLCAHASGLISRIRRQNEELAERISYSDIEIAFARYAAENEDKKDMLVELLELMQDGKYDSRLYAIQRHLQDSDSTFNELPPAMPSIALCEFENYPSQMFDFVAGNDINTKKQKLKDIIDDLKDEVAKLIKCKEKPGNDTLISVLKNYYSKHELTLIPSRKVYSTFFAPIINLTAKGSFDNFKTKIKEIFPRLDSME
ncbi:MAG: hypothetical protein IKQ72_10550 [Bacteroidaceae bacterium]|nr:hypothetical protein [Bacteroidaceae bacterium]